jgi:DNA (cytosine-5)-methyltransferase 1
MATKYRGTQGIMGVKVGGQSRTPGVGHNAGWKDAARIMEIDWMNRDELSQAIPPAYTEHIGRQLLLALEHEGRR